MIVKLQAGDYTAFINPERGANCISLRNSKYKAIILREPNKSGVLDNPYLYGMPILYPANRISGGSFRFEGRTYKFPINEPGTNCHLHGMLHEMEFEITKSDKSFVKCVFEKPYLDFPHSFRIEMTYRLSADGLEQRTKITNLSEENMPNFLGFHATFNVPFLEGASAEDVRLYAEIGNKIERDRNYLPTGRLLSYDDVDEKINSGEFMPLEKVISRHYRTKKGGQIELKEIKQGIKLMYENDEKFGWRLIYNGDGTQYICLEPQTCMANCPNSPFDREFTGFSWLEPGDEREFISHISCTPATMQEYEEYIKNGTKPKK